MKKESYKLLRKGTFELRRRETDGERVKNILSEEKFELTRGGKERNKEMIRLDFFLLRLL